MRMILSLMLILLAVLGGVASAQDIPTFCGDLSDDDCALLTEAAETMATELESAVFHMNLDLEVSGIPDPRFSTMNFHIAGDGAMAIDSEALSGLMGLYTNMPESMEELPQIFEDAIRAISADVTLVFDVPTELFEVSWNSDAPIPEKVSLSVRLVDGFAYVNLDKLAELDVYGNSMWPRGWQGIDLAGFYGALIERQMDMMEGMMTSSATAEYMSAFTDPEFLSHFLTIERLEDTQVGEQAAATFQVTIDYGALFSDPVVLEYLSEQMGNMGGFGDTKSNQEMIDMMMSFYTEMFDGLLLEMTQTIGLDDHYVHQIGAHMDWTPDFGSLMGGGTATPDINLIFDMQVDLSRFNDAPEIVAPEDANIYPLDMMLPTFNQ